MWRLKYNYIHSDCRYTKKSKELKVVVATFPLNNFIKDKKFYLTAIHLLDGNPTNVSKYTHYLKKISKKTEQITNNIIFSLVEIKKNINYYRSFYNPSLIYLTPIIHKEGFEHIDIASWDRKVLSDILGFLEKNKNTKLLKILRFEEEKLKDVFLMRTVPKITKRQREIFELAIKNGYYNYPRKINLDGLSKINKISKSNLHEILRRAESNILKYFI